MRTTVLVPLLLLSQWALAQCSPGLNIQKAGEQQFDYPKQAMTARHDANGKPYLYIAAKERGVLIWDISDPAHPTQVDSVPNSFWGNAEPMSLTQDGNYLYVALGNVFVNSSQPGLAIIDVSNPKFALPISAWVQNVGSGGAGCVKISGNYAYLGAMRQGIIVLDISDKSNVTYHSGFIPDRNFPVANPDTLKYNARGIYIDNNKLYLAYDAGGVRVIDISNPASLSEIGHYSNALLNNRPRAYNNMVVDDGLAYVATDYCGMEVLNVSNPSNITQTGWWNPWNCDNAAANNWFNSKGHTNEIEYNKNCHLLFMSSGKSELDVVNVSNPAQPYLCDSFGNTTNTEGTWGVGLYQSQVYLNYIYVPLGIPFYSNWGGVRILTWDNSCSTGIGELKNQLSALNVYPDPSTGIYTLQLGSVQDQFTIEVYDRVGSLQYSGSYRNSSSTTIDLSALPSGSYFLAVKTGGAVQYRQLCKI